jgi:hypothetical protein
MSAKTVAAFLAGAVVASTGTAAALTSGNSYRLQEGDEARYGPIYCQAQHVPPYSEVRCRGAYRYLITYGRSQIQVLRMNNKHVLKQVFTVDPSGAR